MAREIAENQKKPMKRPYLEESFPFVPGAKLIRTNGNPIEHGWLDGSELMEELDGIYFSIRPAGNVVYIGVEEADALLLNEMTTEALSACADCLSTTLRSGEKIHLKSKPDFSFFDADVILSN